MLKPVLDIAIPALAILTIAIVGLQLTAADFVRISRQPLLVCLATIAQALLLPLLGVGLLSVLDLKPHLAKGLILVAVCPAGSMANFHSYLARANVALSVTLTTVSCLAAVVTMPLLMAAFQSDVGNLEFDVPLPTLAGQLLLLLLFPILVGMMVRHFRPHFLERWSRPLFALALAALAALLAFVIVQESDHFLNDLPEIAPAVVLLTMAAMLAGYGTGWALRTEKADRFSLGLVFVVRNVGLATAIAVTVLGRLEFAVFATAYFLSQTPILLAASIVFRYWGMRGQSPNAGIARR